MITMFKVLNKPVEVDDKLIKLQIHEFPDFAWLIFKKILYLNKISYLQG